MWAAWGRRFPHVIMLFALLALTLALASFPLAREAAPDPIRVTDIAGREIVLARPAQRIVLGAWVSFDALSLLHPDPVGLLAGWAEGGANAIQPAILRARFPAIDRVPVIGRGSFESISAEAVIAQKPDLVRVMLGIHQKATDFAATNKGAMVAMASSKLGQKKEAIEASVPNVELTWKLEAKQIEQSKIYADHMLALKQIKRLPDFATFIDTSFVDAVKPT